MSRTVGTSRAIVAIALVCFTCLTTLPSTGVANPYGSPGSLSDPQSAGGGLGGSASISSDGTVAVVGEPNYNAGAGAALVYADSNGAWSLVQRLMPTGEAGAGHFGAAVSIDPSGQTVVVGAPRNNGGVGAAWAFALTNGTWTQQGLLLGGAGETGAGEFGASVAIDSGGAVALVGAPMSDAGEGQVFTFYYESNPGWYLHQHMKREGVSGAAHFGASVAIDNNAGDALVGAPNAASGNGAIYPYTYFGLESPYWIEQPPITSPAAGSNFGASVAISLGGEYDLAGAPLATGGEGAAYEYLVNGTQQAAFTDPAASPGGHFGASVSAAGFYTVEQLVVGAPGENSGAGAAYEFDAANGANWLTDGAALNPAVAPAVGDAYGTSVAVAPGASSVVVGAPGAGAANGAATHFASVPSPPLSVHAVAGAQSATVSWSVPESTGGSPITGYTVSSSSGGFGCHATSALTCSVSGLTAGQAYTFTVSATNAVGTSAPSSASNAVTPEAPSGSDGGSGGVGHLVGGVSSSAGGEASLSGVGAADANGSGHEGGATGSSSRSPSGPSGAIKITKRTKTSITFSWGTWQAGSGVAGYRIYEYLRGRWKLVASTQANKRSFTRRGLRHRTRHRFEVRAYNGVGQLSAPLRGAWFTTE